MNEGVESDKGIESDGETGQAKQRMGEGMESDGETGQAKTKNGRRRGIERGSKID